MSSQRTHFKKGGSIRACAHKSTPVASVESQVQTWREYDAL